MVVIERMSTADELKDYERLGNKTPWELFLRKLSKLGQVFAKKYIPFDETCAKIDFKDKLEQAERESERIHGYVRERDVEGVELDLEKYGDVGRFELVNDDEDLQDKLVDGMRTQVKIGHTLKYKCKLRGHFVSVFIPTLVYEEMYEKRKKED